MGAAALKLDKDGNAAWDEIWTDFCDLALAGGPPHRGSLLEPVSTAAVAADPEGYQRVIAELERGIKMVTGLPVVQSSSPGWIGMECQSEAMALWLLRAIIVENISVRREGATLYFPAGPAFRLEKEIKNVITVIAKTNHYWQEHIASHPGMTLPPLLTDQVHLWHGHLPLFSTQAAGLLNAEEQARAARFATPQLQARFVAARGALRRLLAAYLREAPEALAFHYGPHGKPELRASPLCFNLAHAEDWLVIGVAWRVAVGVDLEQVRPLDDLERVARHHFTPQEQAALLTLPAAQRLRAFYACWTRKEAVVKATGAGLSAALTRVEVSLAPGAPAQVLRLGAQLAPAWTLFSFEVAEGWQGAPGRAASRAGGAALRP
ncbi:MAG: 4'-phosphopantetheinyl transferase superfamily protein [Anaerolineae bacterium]|nr:4'-phosphopantetheinyl transferase superfamily protein [Anaerolineae bacterium]